MRSSIVLAAAALLCLAGTAAANPIMVVMYSEVRVAPDSLEAIELYPYENVVCPLDLSGYRIVTGAGTVIVDSGVVLEDSTCLVLDRSNTTGTFSLGDSCDSIVIQDPQGWPIGGGQLRYPGYHYDGPGFTPGRGLSAALFQRYVPGIEPYYWYQWYTDSTPTLGSRNDDTLGRISGRVLDDRGWPLVSAQVLLRNRQGYEYTYTDSGGRYSVWPLGPGVYEVSAWKPGHLNGLFPDSVRLGVNRQVDTVDIWLYRVGVAEASATQDASRRTPEATVVRRELWLGTRSKLPGNLVMSRAVLLDAAGRRALDLHSGPNDVSSLSAGVYFVHFGDASRRVVLAR